MRRLVMTWFVGLTLGVPAVCGAQAYGGATVGVGGAHVPFGSYGGGFRGLLRLFGGYGFTRNIAAEAMTFDLGIPGNRPGNDSTIGAFAVAGVGTLPVRRWRFTGHLGVMSMDGRALGVTTRTAQGMVGVGAGFDVLRKLTIGFETARSRVKFGAPIDDTVPVKWAGVVAAYRF
jgi:hypothetical protein